MEQGGLKRCSCQGLWRDWRKGSYLYLQRWFCRWSLVWTIIIRKISSQTYDNIKLKGSDFSANIEPILDGVQFGKPPGLDWPESPLEEHQAGRSGFFIPHFPTMHCIVEPVANISIFTLDCYFHIYVTVRWNIPDLKTVSGRVQI